MNKAAFVLAVAELTGDSIKHTTRVVDAMLKVMVHTPASGEPLSITGFGTLEPYIASQRTRRNPATGSTIEVPEKIRIRFRPAERFHALANGDVELPATAAELDVKAPKYSPAPLAPQADEQGAP